MASVIDDESSVVMARRRVVDLDICSSSNCAFRRCASEMGSLALLLFLRVLLLLLRLEQNDEND